jgi:5'(3')-deoxyribonucleotidase
VRQPRLCVDIDNCVAATDEVMRRLICDVTNGRVNFRYEDVREFDYHGPLCSDKAGEGIDEATWKVVHDQFSEPDVVLSIQPLDGAVEALRSLQGDFDIHFVTTRKPKARAATIHWLDRLGLGDSRPHSVHFVGHREKHEAIGRPTAAIDDDAVQAGSFAAIGVTSILLDHPWNQTAKPTVIRAADWKAIEQALRK